MLVIRCFSRTQEEWLLCWKKLWGFSCDFECSDYWEIIWIEESINIPYTFDALWDQSDDGLMLLLSSWFFGIHASPNLFLNPPNIDFFFFKRHLLLISYDLQDSFSRNDFFLKAINEPTPFIFSLLFLILNLLSCKFESKYTFLYLYDSPFSYCPNFLLVWAMFYWQGLKVDFNTSFSLLTICSISLSLVTEFFASSI